jgi:hypothetical protein
MAAPIFREHCRMTVRKASLPLPQRTPAYVSREVGAAELCISPETWDRMVAAGELPKADKRFLGTATVGVDDRSSLLEGRSRDANNVG